MKIYMTQEQLNAYRRELPDSNMLDMITVIDPEDTPRMEWTACGLCGRTVDGCSLRPHVCLVSLAWTKAIEGE